MNKSLYHDMSIVLYANECLCLTGSPYFQLSLPFHRPKKYSNILSKQNRMVVKIIIATNL